MAALGDKIIANIQDMIENIDSQATEILSQEIDSQMTERLSQETEICCSQEGTSYQPKPETINYYILAHGSIDLNPPLLSYDNIKHIASRGEKLLSHVIRSKDGIKFPILSNLCEGLTILEKNIDIDILLSSRDCTNDYDGVYVCEDKIAVRILHFKKEKELYKKYRLSDIINFIWSYKNSQRDYRPYTIGVISCLTVKGDTDPPLCDKRYEPKDCHPLGLGRSVTLDSKKQKKGGKSKIKRRSKKRSKKTSQKYRRRR